MAGRGDGQNGVSECFFFFFFLPAAFAQQPFELQMST